MAVSEARIGEETPSVRLSGGRVRRSRWAVYDWWPTAHSCSSRAGAAWIAATSSARHKSAKPYTSCRSRSRMDTVPADRRALWLPGTGSRRPGPSCREKRSRPAPPPATRPRHSLQGSGGGGGHPLQHGGLRGCDVVSDHLAVTDRVDRPLDSCEAIRRARIDRSISSVAGSPMSGLRYRAPDRMRAAPEQVRAIGNRVTPVSLTERAPPRAPVSELPTPRGGEFRVRVESDAGRRRGETASAAWSCITVSASGRATRPGHSPCSVERTRIAPLCGPFQSGSSGS